MTWRRPLALIPVITVASLSVAGVVMALTDGSSEPTVQAGGERGSDSRVEAGQGGLGEVRIFLGGGVSYSTCEGVVGASASEQSDPSGGTTTTVVGSVGGFTNVAGPCPPSTTRSPKLDATIDSSRYPSSTEFRLEAFVSVPAGSTYCLRIYDVTAGAAVDGSEVCRTHDGGARSEPADSEPPDTPLPSGDSSFPSNSPSLDHLRIQDDTPLQEKVQSPFVPLADGEHLYAVEHSVNGARGLVSELSLTLRWP